ncbi:MAG TPA: trypsin-like peptidase domain-containing protein [Candidatus Saccharibacteria bacterium]|nr:trypsin-like peptidase domain-containing protein [Candidatus Saccharibacteria bacterium]HMR38123.1 trypsin-like peptidase domain-containing protein [Candidatus Saccharibacteria bacterium]
MEQQKKQGAKSQGHTTPAHAQVSPKQLPKSQSSMKWAIFAVISVLVVAWGVSGAVILYQKMNENNQVTERPLIEGDGNKMVSSEETTIAAVAKKVSPSVVSIVTEKSSTSIWGETTQSGAGSGFIVGSDGYILTNRHVVSGANQFEVVLSDGRTYDSVKLVATDPLNDIAFLKIDDAKDLPVVELGDSTTVQVGQRAIAIGNSLGQYQNTVTSGIISGTGRPIAASDGQRVEQLTDLLQTDAAINPGNSGGPLLNSAGQVIGINTAIVENAQSLGFAIPINATKGMLKQVLAGTRPVQRAYIGVAYTPVNAQVAKEHSLPVSQGAFVYSESRRAAVESGGPADAAGVQPGDVITKVNAVELGAKGSLLSLISEYAPGDTVRLTINRKGETKELTVKLGAYSS